MQEAMIIEEKFETAEEFLEALRITKNRWVSKPNSWESSWIFRGQADAKWHLIPSAWRSDSKLKRFKEKYRPRFEEIHSARLKRVEEGLSKQVMHGEFTEDEGNERKLAIRSRMTRELEFSLQYFAEYQAVKEFTEFADKLGHPVPGANDFLIHQTDDSDLPEEDFLIAQFYRWPLFYNALKVDCSAVALAQHHGVPTRLLDWTENPLIAAFFAGEEFILGSQTAKKRESHKRRIAVWAISKEIFSGKENEKIGHTHLQLISRPRHEISYLLAQKSVFTHDKAGNEIFLDGGGRWRSVEEAIGNDPEYLKKLTLPVSEVGELLRLLWLEGVTRAHLMPTYDNVTRTLETKAWWENR